MNQNEWIDNSTTPATVYRAIEATPVGASEDDCSGCAFYYAWKEDLCSPEIARSEGRPCWCPDRKDHVDVWWEEVEI